MPSDEPERRLFALDSTRAARRAVERSVDDELAFHIANRVDDLVRGGLSREAAEAEARRQFGDLEAARAELATIDRRRLTRLVRLTWWSDLLQDTRLALRTLSAQRGFTAVVLLTMALGIGANGAMYSVVDAVLVRPLPFHEPTRLVYMEETKKGSTDRSVASYPDFLDWRAQSRAFAALEGFDPTNVTILGGDEPVRAQGARTTAGFLQLLGVSPILGRTLTSGEDAPGDTPVVVISYGFWQRWFAGDPQILRRSLVVDGVSRTIVGVLPRGFMFALIGDADLWMPIDRTAEVRAQRFNYWLRVVGRLGPGIPIERARSDLGTVMERLAMQYPESNAGRGINVVPLRDQMVRDVRSTLLVLLGAVVLVLLIACTNVASLLLARAMTRGREMAVRVALGAGRGRLIRQLLCENLLLSLGGGLLGVWIGHAAFGTLAGVIHLGNARAMIPDVQNLTLDRNVLVYLAAITLGTGVAVGLAPALFASRPALGMLMSGDRRATAGAARVGLRSALVTLEIALTVVLLVGAGLLTRSLTRLLRVDPGFDATRTLSLRVAFPGNRYNSVTARRSFIETVIERARTLPGMESVGAVSVLPLSGSGTVTFRIEGLPEPDPALRPEAVTRAVAGDYFRALGIRLIDGRVLTSRDDSIAPQAIMISESLARRFFGSKRAVGERFRIYGWADQPWTVAGVVADVKNARLDLEAPHTVYYSHLQGNEGRMSLVLRSASDPAALASSLRSIVHGLDPALAVYAVRALEREITDSPAVDARRYALVLIGAFAGVALILAIVGIAGVMSYSVSQRQREIGIRVALGAARHTVLLMILRQGGVLALGGVALGVIAALGGSRWLGSVLYGVGPADPLTYSVIALVIVAVALIASYVPARRAARVDPSAVLRAE